jgi:hypothetical protein
MYQAAFGALAGSEKCSRISPLQRGLAPVQAQTAHLLLRSMASLTLGEQRSYITPELHSLGQHGWSEKKGEKCQPHHIPPEGA